MVSLTGDDYLSTLDTDEFSKFVARYKFVIAYENSICNDYITEKLWRPLILGVVPIYFGAPNVDVKTFTISVTLPERTPSTILF